MCGVKMKQVVGHTTGLQAVTGSTDVQRAAEYLDRCAEPCAEGTRAEKGTGPARSAAASCSNNRAAWHDSPRSGRKLAKMSGHVRKEGLGLHSKLGDKYKVGGGGSLDDVPLHFPEAEDNDHWTPSERKYLSKWDEELLDHTWTFKPVTVKQFTLTNFAADQFKSKVLQTIIRYHWCSGLSVTGRTFHE